MEEQLLNAAKVGDVSTIRRLVAEGADVNVSGPRGFSPLQWAAHHGHVDAVRVLVEAGAEVEAPAADGVRPLYLAAEGGHLAVVKTLVELTKRRLLLVDRHRCTGRHITGMWQ